LQHLKKDNPACSMMIPLTIPARGRGSENQAAIGTFTGIPGPMTFAGLNPQKNTCLHYLRYPYLEDWFPGKGCEEVKNSDLAP
jgi:hypothetical protein